MAKQEQKNDDNQQVEPKKGFWSKAWSFAKDVFSKGAGAIAGAAVGSIVPGVGTIAGFFIGLAVHLAVEKGVNTLMNDSEKAIENAEDHKKTPAETVQASEGSSVTMYKGLELQPKTKNENSISPEARISQIPQPKPGSVTKEVPEFAGSNTSSIKSPFATPRLVPPAA